MISASVLRVVLVAYDVILILRIGGTRLSASLRSLVATRPYRRVTQKQGFSSQKIFDCGIKSAAVYAAKAEIFCWKTERPAKVYGGADLAFVKRCVRHSRRMRRREIAGWALKRIASCGGRSGRRNGKSGREAYAEHQDNHARMHTCLHTPMKLKQRLPPLRDMCTAQWLQGFTLKEKVISGQSVKRSVANPA